MYNIDATLDGNHSQLSCLYYSHRESMKVAEKIDYCLGSIDNKNSWNDDFLNTRDQNFTFGELRQMNVTVEELISWFATIDLAEQYQYYLDNYYNFSASEEIFYNCTNPWFGPRCQYSFLFPTVFTFERIVMKTFHQKFYKDIPYDVVPSTCYTHLECDRGGSGMCLDWREICDGRIDCLDGGADEAQCFDLEVNECGENEYRCHNGLCIPKEFLEDDQAQCLDKTDISDILSYPGKIDNSFIFSYEENTCRSGYKSFPCGDGRCVADFDACHSKRHLFLIASISAQGNLSYECWTIMICLTKISDQVNGTTCDQLFKLSNISIYLATCPVLLPFPTVPILFGHVRFLYRRIDTRHIDVDRSLTPDYVCYDPRLCDFLRPTFLTGNYSCRPSDTFDFDLSMKLQNWSSVIRMIEPHFHKCLTGWNHKNHSYHPSLYRCKNSSKYISKHRVLDSIADCYHNDDETQFDLSCSIRDPRRFTCNNEPKCYLKPFSRETCSVMDLRNLDEIEFQEICDRIVQVFPIMIDGQNHTDETECNSWPCNNYYTRCDGFWSCSDGKDEENCTTPQVCRFGTLPCVSPYNHTLTCLPANRVGDGHFDCLGGADEREYCRRHLAEELFFEGFRCWNDETCISPFQLCDGVVHCPLADDEAFCEDHEDICDGSYEVERTDAEEALCRLMYFKKISFSLKTSLPYPPEETTTTTSMTYQMIQRRSIRNIVTHEADDSAWLWLCNHGISVRHWLGNNNFSNKCFCPPSYYGDQCQYQNQRVSFTAKMRIVNSRGAFAVVIALVDDDNDREEINSYQKFVSMTTVTCERNFIGYLTYSKRPKSKLTNYSIHVNVFNTTSLANFSSWYFHFNIPFPFLPVHRMAILLEVPADQMSSPSYCPLTCQHGECMKYINKEKFFCQCHVGWSGARCNIPVRCSDCSPDSICIGEFRNRSVCVCPPDKDGPRCLLHYSCPTDYCQNNGQCVVLDGSGYGLKYACNCSEQYYGAACQILKNRLEISFHDIEMSSHLLIYFVYTRSVNVVKKVLSIQILPYKLSMFQHTTVLYLKFTFSLIFIKLDDRYYLAALQEFAQDNISTSISPTQRCLSVIELLNSKMFALPEIRRVKYYHVLCQTHISLVCFFDEYYMCLCTLERHANCFKFDQTPLKCRQQNHCQNGGTCLYFDPVCQDETTCICTDCFYGDRCELYARGIGLTLDDILRYEIRFNTTMSDQTHTVKWSAAWTIILFIGTLISSGLSTMTFSTEESKAIGCGLYLLASSITSILTMSVFTMKFWFLLLTQIYPLASRSVLQGGCIAFEFILKVCLYTDNWLNACVALDRLVTVYKEAKFNKMLSKRVARWIIFILPIFVAISIIHELLNRDLYDDKEENRSWCVFRYSPSVHRYNTIIIFFHFIGAFCANLFSALFIIFRSARRRVVTQKRLTYKQHLQKQFKEHKNLIVSPIALVVLTLPRLIISFLSQCVKVSHNTSLYLLGYFVSFIPSMALFFVFVLPSKFYRKQLKTSMKPLRRYFS